MSDDVVGFAWTPWTVLLLGPEQGKPLELNPGDPLATIRTQIGGAVNRVRHLHGMDFWVGDDSVASSSVNEGATNLLSMLLSAAASGDIPVSTQERAHAQRMLTCEPVLHGTCLVTGVDAHSNPIGLPDLFWNWFLGVFNAARAQAAVDRIVQGLADQGVEITVIGLREL